MTKLVLKAFTGCTTKAIVVYLTPRAGKIVELLALLKRKTVTGKLLMTNTQAMYHITLFGDRQTAAAM